MLKSIGAQLEVVDNVVTPAFACLPRRRLVAERHNDASHAGAILRSTAALHYELCDTYLFGERIGCEFMYGGAGKNAFEAASETTANGIPSRYKLPPVKAFRSKGSQLVEAPVSNLGVLLVPLAGFAGRLSA